MRTQLASPLHICYPLGNSSTLVVITQRGISMDILVRDRKLGAALADDVACRRRFGTDMAKKIRLRVLALEAAESLGDFWPPLSGPERCHELKADLAGTFSMDVKQPYRLLFKPAEESTEDLDEKQRWHSIKAIDIVGIEDTHG